MNRGRPRIVIIGGTYRALSVLEHLLERGERVVAFIGQEGEGERDFCPEILEICDRHSIPARSARKLGEEIVRWLEDRIRPDVAIAVGVTTQVPLAIGGNCRLGLVEIIDCFQSDSCPGVVLRQRGQEISIRRLAEASSTDERDDAYLQMIDAIVEQLDGYLESLSPASADTEVTVPFTTHNVPAGLEELSSRSGEGEETRRFERELARFLGAQQTFALRSQQDAFRLLWSSLGLQEHDEVICPSIISSEAVDSIRSLGARPIFVDVERGRLSLDPARLAVALSPRTRVMVISHPFGQPAALDELYHTAEEVGIEVIEDAGESLGARFRGERLGKSPCTCVFRTAAGAALTVPDALAERVASNLSGERMGDAAAVVERAALASLEGELAARRRTAAEYSAALVRYDAFQIPPTPEDALPVYASYVLRITRFSRTLPEDLHKLLLDSGIEVRRIRVPLSDRELARLGVADSLTSQGLLLPIGSHLRPDQVEHVLDCLFSFAIG